MWFPELQHCVFLIPKYTMYKKNQETIAQWRKEVKGKSSEGKKWTEDVPQNNQMLTFKTSNMNKK